MNLSEKETQSLLSLLSFSLFQQKAKADRGSVDWKKLISYANDHVVTPLLYPAVLNQPDVPVDIFESVQRHAVRSSVKTERTANVQGAALNALNNGAIPCAVLKGMSAASGYPYPELRLPGDIDILINGADLENADRLLQQAGFLFTEKNDLHRTYRKDGVTLELHSRVSRFPDSLKARFTQEFLDGAERQTCIQTLGSHFFPVLRQPYRTVSLLVHMERHMGSSGIGLRQLCDWAVCIHHTEPEDERELLGVLGSCGLLHFARILTKCAEKYLGLPQRIWAQDAPDEIVTQVMEDILSAGDFQLQHRKQPFGSAVADPYGFADCGRGNPLSTYVRRVKRKMRTEYSWATSIWYVPLFCIFYPIKWIADVAGGRKPYVNVFRVFRVARKRERLLRKLQLYR